MCENNGQECKQEDKQEHKPEHKQEQFYVYMLRCEDHSIYTGIAKDVQRRFSEHQQRKKEGAKYTKSHPVSRVEAIFAASSRSDASKLEYAIKQLKKEQKEWLIVHPEQWKEIMPERISGCAFTPVRVE